MIYGRFVFAPTLFNVMLEIDLSLGFNSRYMLPLFLPKIYDPTSYVTTYISHFQQMFNSILL